ncbi:unnamed protein product [Rhodiola kirilowii]
MLKMRFSRCSNTFGVHSFGWISSDGRGIVTWWWLDLFCSSFPLDFGTIELLPHPQPAPLINQYSARRIKRISTSSLPHRPWLKIQASTQDLWNLISCSGMPVAVSTKRTFSRQVDLKLSPILKNIKAYTLNSSFMVNPAFLSLLFFFKLLGM